MLKINTIKFSSKYKELCHNKKIKDRHYYIDNSNKGHIHLANEIKDFKIWTVILYGYKKPKIKYPKIPKIFRILSRTWWLQLYFIDNGKEIIIYRGTTTGSGYRETHGILANAFSYLKNKYNKQIPTFILGQGARGGLHIIESSELLVHGHELNGNYKISHEKLDKNIPKSIRVYNLSSCYELLAGTTKTPKN